jgi:hypothetical protein
MDRKSSEIEAQWVHTFFCCDFTLKIQQLHEFFVISCIKESNFVFENLMNRVCVILNQMQLYIEDFSRKI